MEDSQLIMIIEGVLLVAGRTLDINQIEKIFDKESVSSKDSDSLSPRFSSMSQRPSREEIYLALEKIGLSCTDRSFELKQTASGYRLQVKNELSSWVGRLWEEKPKKYSRAFLETLSLIAYKQPVTRGEIEEIRGVAVSSDTIRSLLEREWIKVVGNKDVPGRPALYASTKQFLSYFNLKNLKELPALSEIKDIGEIHPELILGDMKQSDIEDKYSKNILTKENKSNLRVDDPESLK